MITTVLKFLAGGILIKILIAQYVVITLVYISQRRWDQILYWSGATLLNIGVLMGLNKISP